MFRSSSFSKFLLQEKSNFLNGDISDHNKIQDYFRELKDFDLNQLDSDSKKKAFWINVYNGMTNWFIIEKNIRKSVKEFKPSIFSIPIEIGKQLFSLDAIEHGILRKNADNSLNNNDQNARVMVDQLDFRIHFALNCGAVSCPVSNVYFPRTVDKQLDEAEKHFVATEFLVQHTTKTIHCSYLFIKYQEDFGDHYLKNPLYKDFKIVVKDYNWSIDTRLQP